MKNTLTLTVWAYLAITRDGTDTDKNGHRNYKTESASGWSLYIEIQGTTPNVCPKNIGIFVSEMGQLQGLFGT